MTAEIINLRRARKSRRRREEEATAAENRIRFGQKKQDEDAVKAEAEKALRMLDGHRLENGFRDEDGA